MGLGSFPDVSLAEAREAARIARKQARDGLDPIEARKAAGRATPSFTRCAAEYIRAHRRGWRNAKHGRQWVSTLKAYARPVIGGKAIDRIETEDILAILKPIWHTKTETAKRVQGRIENILDYAAAHKYRDPVNPARWRGHLDKLLPRPTRVQKPKHHPAMPYAEVPAFFAELEAIGTPSALALQFMILTATRTNEVIQAQWSEIDIDQAIWTVPAERMKAGREHRVPLADAALRVLQRLPRVESNPYVFVGSLRAQPLSNQAMLTQMRRLGFGSTGDRGRYVPHGFRSSFRDWAGEVSNFPRDIAEMALAHVIENKTEAAYARGDLIAKRRRLMREWAMYITRKYALTQR
jgi:integrase